jgi:hypothetical protein
MTIINLIIVHDVGQLQPSNSTSGVPRSGVPSLFEHGVIPPAVDSNNDDDDDDKQDTTNDSSAEAQKMDTSAVVDTNDDDDDEVFPVHSTRESTDSRIGGVATSPPDEGNEKITQQQKQTSEAVVAIPEYDDNESLVEPDDSCSSSEDILVSAQHICENCEEEPSDVHCDECDLNLCDDCDVSFHVCFSCAVKKE